MDTSKSVIEEEEAEEEEEWSNNDTGWTKYFESHGNECESAPRYIKEDDGGGEIMEDDDSLASDASSGPAFFEDLYNRRSEDCELFDDKVEEGQGKREQEKNRFCKKDRKMVKEKEKRRNFIK
ncbi:uncharacterized protein LOC110024051 [Phalaenopsis equestris]|uniref:uncharacterized protein LOC110024051 n=1 Tax=Phalaenopsis equestris TaxID=78828 RepID=UPI0009E32E8A|nr:uncharacterized protein LOC110024051 [Phalaenopsis equestris]